MSSERFIALDSKMWNIDYVKWIECNEEYCSCEVADYRSRCDRRWHSGSTILKAEKGTLSYDSLLRICTQK